MSATAWIDLSLLMTEVKETVRLAVVTQVRPSWREKLWTADPKTRLDVDEVAEALHKSVPAVRALIKRHGFPCRRRHNELTFIVGEVRQWLERHESIINAPVVSIGSRGAKQGRS
jgi:predicted DNA-binding transcriptional regulator AlpA